MTAQSSSVNVVIIGGGITGLSAAYTLKQRAQQERKDLTCMLFEKDSRLGGKIRTHRENGFVMEEGPDSILARKPSGIGLMKQLGVESEVVGSNPAAMKTFILFRGKLEPIPPGTNMGIPAKMGPFATTNLVSTAGKARALLDLVIPKSDISGDAPLGWFLRRRLGDEVVSHVVEPLLAGIYAGSVDDLSLKATFPQFLQLEQKHRSLILGSVRQRRQAPPTQTSSQGRSAFVTLKSGLQTIVERLYDELHSWAKLETNTAVQSIERLDDGRYRVSVTRNGEAYTVEADSVIVSTPATDAARLLSPLCTEAQSLSQIPYVSTAAVLLGYNKDMLPDDMEGSGFVIPRIEGRGITACTWTSNKWPHTAPNKQALVRCYIGRAGQQEVLQLNDEEMVDMVKSELRSILGLNAAPWFTRVVRWNQAMPQYLVNHKERVKTVESALLHHTPGLYIAGAAYHGVGIPDCIDNGQQAAQEVLLYLNK